MMGRGMYLAAVLTGLLLCGCSSWWPHPVEEIQAHEFILGTNLQQAYDALLDNVAWQKVNEKDGSYVQVSGLVAGGGTSLSVRYDSKARPPVVLGYIIDGRSGQPEAFAAELQDLLLRSAIMALPAGSAGATGSE